MSVTVGNNFNPSPVEEFFVGRYIRRYEILLALHLAHLILSQRLHILAYASNSDFSRQQTWYDTQWMYHWCCRIRSPEHQFTITVFGSNGLASEVDIVKIDYLGTPTTIGTVTVNSYTPASVTFSLTEAELEPTDWWIRFQIIGRVGSTRTASLMGFVMHEEPVTLNAAGQVYKTHSLKDSSAGGLETLRSEAFEGDVSYNRIAVIRFLDTLQACLADRTRGCAVAYGYDHPPVLGSMYWRAWGPIKFPVARHCSSAKIILDTYGPGTDWPALDIAVTAYTSGVKEAFNDRLFVYNTPVTVGSSANVLSDAPTVLNNIAVTAGTTNNFFIVFKSLFDQTPLVDNSLEFEYKSLGMAKVRGTDEDHWVFYPGTSTYLPNPPYGYHLEMEPRDDAGFNRGNNNASYSGEVVDTSQVAIGSNAGVIFDYCLVRSYNDQNNVSISMSPAPNFIYDDLQDGGQDSTDGEEKTRARLYQHSIQLVASVWINEEFDPGVGIGQHAVRQGTMPSAGRMRQAVQMLNDMAVQGPQIPLMAVNSGPQEMNIGGDPVIEAGEWKWLPIAIEEYEEPQTGGGAESVEWEQVACGILCLPLNRSSPKKKSDLFNVEIDWLGIITADKDVTTNDGLTLRFKVAVEKYESSSPTIPTEIVSFTSEVEGVRDKFIPEKDMSTHTEWAALTPLSAAGRAGKRVDLINGVTSEPIIIGSASAYAWPQEISEDAYPFRTHRFTIDLTDWIEDGLEPEDCHITVYCELHSWLQEGPGPETTSPTRQQTRMQGGVCIAGVGINALNYKED